MGALDHGGGPGLEKKTDVGAIVVREVLWRFITH